MATDEEVERKVDAEAEGDQMVREGDPEWSTDDPEEVHKGLGSSAVGDLLTDVGAGWTTVARLSLAVLLFGGFIVAFYGLALLVQNHLGTHAALLVIGLASMGLAYILAQVYARRGWI